FSMFAAATVMVSILSRFASAPWYDGDFLNFWLNHVFAIALPLWMLASRRFKPQKKYILPVAGCVVAYFLVVYGVSEWLMSAGRLTVENSYSYVYDPEGVGLLEWLFKLIPVPCLYLVPLIPPMLGFFWLLTFIFKKYEVQPFGAERKIKKTD
ncbi:MAG: YwaF family protein, partial [Clostridia bacterium]|nr:YwaF family protein [Clostridia bacterium]